MLLLALWNYIRGYVIILVEGYFIEKFMNICTRRQILLWDLKVQKECSIILKISIKGFRLLRPIARKTRCRVRIIRKKGLPFLLNKYRRRKTFLAGGVLFVLLLYLMTSFIWSIEINGNTALETSYLEEILAEHGIRTGILKFGINTKKAVSELLMDIDEISWLSMDVKGTKVKIELRERISIPEIIPQDKPCDIVAVKDGFIKQILVTDGKEAVKEGDTVTKGQLLISGSIPIKNEKDKFKLVHAMGIVKARTWYEEERIVNSELIEEVRTGNVFTDYTLVLFDRNIKLFHKKNTFDNFDVEDVSKKLSFGIDIVLPFELKTRNYFEKEQVIKIINEEEALKIAQDSAINAIKERLPAAAEIVKSDIKFMDDELEGLKIKVILECIEEIGATKEIGGN